MIIQLTQTEILRVKTRAKDSIEKRRLLKFQKSHKLGSTLLDRTLVVTEEIPGHGGGRKGSYYTKEYYALTEQFHHPDHVKLAPAN